MKSLIIIITLLVIVTSFVSTVNPVYADDDLDLVVNAFSGGDIDAWVNLNANDIDVWINGVPIDDIGKQYIMDAVNLSRPNGTYTGASSPGWQGYFGITSNDDTVVIEHKNPGKVTYFVYNGAGCGGKWGVSDGYPDMWSRRQLLGLLPILATQQGQIDVIAEGLGKAIVVLENGKEVEVQTPVETYNAKEAVDNLYSNQIIVNEQLNKLILTHNLSVYVIAVVLGIIVVGLFIWNIYLYRKVR